MNSFRVCVLISKQLTARVYYSSRRQYFNKSLLINIVVKQSNTVNTRWGGMVIATVAETGCSDKRSHCYCFTRNCCSNYARL